MEPDPHPSVAANQRSDAILQRLLAGMSLFTMAMTIPQVWAVWSTHQPSGVSVWSWSAYLLSALLWFWHGLRQGDKNIYLPCVGWALLDLAVIVGVLWKG